MKESAKRLEWLTLEGGEEMQLINASITKRPNLTELVSESCWIHLFSSGGNLGSWLVTLTPDGFLSTLSPTPASFQ